MIFSAIGCTDLRPPQHGWITREGNGAIGGCDETKQTWHLKCEGNQWAGVIGKCQRGEYASVLKYLIAGILMHVYSFS